MCVCERIHIYIYISCLYLCKIYQCAWSCFHIDTGPNSSIYSHPNQEPCISAAFQYASNGISLNFWITIEEEAKKSNDLGMPKRDKIWESKVSIRQIDIADIGKCIIQ